MRSLAASEHEGYEKCSRNPLRFRSYKNTGGGGPEAFWQRAIRRSLSAPCTVLVRRKLFRINTCKTVSKQETLTGIMYLTQGLFWRMLLHDELLPRLPASRRFAV